jgi:hypothetical protein
MKKIAPFISDDLQALIDEGNSILLRNVPDTGTRNSLIAYLGKNDNVVALFVALWELATKNDKIVVINPIEPKR